MKADFALLLVRGILAGIVPLTALAQGDTGAPPTAPAAASAVDPDLDPEAAAVAARDKRIVSDASSLCPGCRFQPAACVTSPDNLARLALLDASGRELFEQTFDCPRTALTAEAKEG